MKNQDTHDEAEGTRTYRPREKGDSVSGMNQTFDFTSACGIPDVNCRYQGISDNATTCPDCLALRRPLKATS